MSIGTYAELRAAVANYTHRADFATGGVNEARVPEFIHLAEKRINRTLQKVGGGEIKNMLLQVSTELLDLPLDFNAMRYLGVFTSGNEHIMEVSYRTPEVMYREWSNQGGGYPRMFTIHGKDGASDVMQATFRPIPDGTYNLIAYYYKKIATLVGGADGLTNWMLTNNPDVYIFGACLEAAGWIRDDAMLASFGTGFARAVEDITESDDDRRVANASPRASPNFRMIKGM